MDYKIIDKTMFPHPRSEYKFWFYNDRHTVSVALGDIFCLKVRIPIHATEQDVRNAFNPDNDKKEIERMFLSYNFFVGALMASYRNDVSTTEKPDKIRVIVKMRNDSTDVYFYHRSIMLKVPFGNPVTIEQIQATLKNDIVFGALTTCFNNAFKGKMLYKRVPDKPIPLRRSDAQGSAQLEKVLEKLDSAKRQRTE